MKDDLVEFFHDMISKFIDEKGVYPHQALSKANNNKFGVMALDLQPQEVLDYISKEIVKGDATEIIYGLDRFCKDGQGTTLGDCIAGVYWNGIEFKPFIIEYQHEPRIVKEICWDNLHWIGHLQGEIDYLKKKTKKERFARWAGSTRN